VSPPEGSAVRFAGGSSADEVGVKHCWSNGGFAGCHGPECGRHARSWPPRNRHLSYL